MKKALWRRLWRKKNKIDTGHQGVLNAAQSLIGSLLDGSFYGPKKKPVPKQPNVGSIAQGTHENKREMSRRLRQLEAAERKKAKVGPIT